MVSIGGKSSGVAMKSTEDWLVCMLTPTMGENASGFVAKSAGTTRLRASSRHFTGTETAAPTLKMTSLTTKKRKMIFDL
mgnify:CR=1 FL=1